MSFIDNTYFIKDITVPVNTVSQSNIDNYIERYENEILQRLLGYELLKNLLADLSGGNPQTQRFIDLVNGAEFSFDLNGNTVNTKWEGLRNSVKKSLIAYWVYFNYRNENEAYFSGIGQRRGKGENSEKADITPKIVSVWNKMIDLYGETPKYYYPYQVTKYNARVTDRFFKVILDKEFFLDQGNYEHYTYEPSAYNFLLANISDYPEWRFDPILKLNIFGM